MQLTNEQICSVALGAAETFLSQDGVEFYRMKTAQAERIAAFNADFGKKAYATAGIRLDFYTDSEYFAFAYDNAQSASSRLGYYFTLFVNGVETALIGEETATAFTGAYRAELPKGKNRVTLFFPNLFRARIKSVELSDGAFFERATPKRRFVFHGDSITHGYDAQSPANAYANRVAYALDAEIFNFAIGAAMLDIRMIDESDGYNADAVFVAYGTNDWAHRTDMQEFSEYCEAFFEKLTALHKTAPVCVILPIWRSDYDAQKPVGSFQEAKDELIRIAKKYENTQILDLFDDIPHELSLFTDGLHPNDAGFAYYAKGVLNKIKL